MKLKFLLPLLKAKIGVLAIVSAAYLGAEYGHVIKRVEHNLLRRHLTYTEDSHRGSLTFEDFENNQGELEKKLKNLETKELVYTMQKDFLPDNGFIFQGLITRMSSYDKNELKDFHSQVVQLERLTKSRVPRQNPVYQNNDLVSQESRNPLPYLVAGVVGSGGLVGYRRFRKRS